MSNHWQLDCYCTAQSNNKESTITPDHRHTIKRKHHNSESQTEFIFYTSNWYIICICIIKTYIFQTHAWVWAFPGCFLILLDILTHWGRVTHICVGKLAIIGSDNGLSPGRLQAIIWTNIWILLIESLGTKFREILLMHFNWYIFIQENVLENVVCKMAAILSRPQCLQVF